MDSGRRQDRDEPRTEAAARRADLADLRRHLPTAPLPYLRGALRNPELSAADLPLLLRNNRAGTDLLRTIGTNRAWTRHYEVKKGLIKHANTPPPLARTFLHHLYWRDLAEIVDDLRIHPTVRKQGEIVLETRLHDMALGERVAFARIASRGLIATLGGTGEEAVLRSLMGNARLVERDVSAIAARENVPGNVLTEIARHPTWGSRHAVRLALVMNPRTPIPTALRLLRTLPRPDLRQLAKTSRAPKIVSLGAERRLQAARGKPVAADETAK